MTIKQFAIKAGKKVNQPPEYIECALVQGGMIDELGEQGAMDMYCSICKIEVK
jgi:hypothetical protein